MVNYYYKSIDWPHTLVLLCREDGPITFMMLHIAAIHYAKTEEELTFEDIIAKNGFLINKWPEPEAFNAFWPQMLIQLKADREYQLSLAERGSRGGRAKAANAEEEPDPLILSLNELAAAAGFPERKIKGTDRDITLELLKASPNPDNVIEEYKNFVANCNNKGVFPVLFSKWHKNQIGLQNNKSKKKGSC